ncbi:TPA: hypothetical protein DIC38_03505 [Candidatus Nomurabacteria bacterium]|nr:MAG: hypothetical protein O210_OD1C00001G0080 [Parcubacteria bacterium RAAC4_OD1_1]HCY26714.1 hypothetical protein [Candidatus Nomurabacteria bacterium]
MDVLFTGGLKGKKVFLEKLDDVEGSISKVSVGKKQEIFVAEEIIVGFPVMKKRVSRHRDEAPRSVNATSAVRKILTVEKEKGLYKFITENSIYEMKVI